MRDATKVLVGALIVATANASSRASKNVTSPANFLLQPRPVPNTIDRPTVLSEHDKHDDEQRTMIGPSVKAISAPDKKPLVEITKWLKMDSAVGRLVETMQPKMYKNVVSEDLETLMQYVIVYIEEIPKSRREVLEALTKHFNDDYSLNKIIELAQLQNSLRNFADRVQNLQFERWIRKQISPQQLCDLLRLNQLGPSVWTTKNCFGISTWLKYFDIYARQYPFDPTTVLNFFTLRFGEEGVTEMLVEGSKKDLSSLAKRLLTEQTQSWLITGKRPISILGLWQLNRVKDENLLEKKLFLPWVLYTRKIQVLDHDRMQTVPILLHFYEYDILISMVREAYKNPATRSVAEEFLLDFQRFWLSERFIKTLREMLGNRLDTEVSLHSLFYALKLEVNMDELLVNPLFLYWYNHKTNIRIFPIPIESNPIVVLQHVFGGRRKLHYLVIRATYVETTKVIAKVLLTQLIHQSLNMGKEPEMHISLLGATKSTEVAIHKDYTAALKMIMTEYEDPTRKIAAESWQKKLLQFWHNGNAPVEVVFNILELETLMVDLLANPLFRLWYRYILEWQPDNGQITRNPIEVLEGMSNGYDKLHLLLEDASQKPVVEVLAKFLLTLQMTLKMRKTENVALDFSLPDAELANGVREDYDAVLKQFASFSIDEPKNKEAL